MRLRTLALLMFIGVLAASPAEAKPKPGHTNNGHHNTSSTGGGSQSRPDQDGVGMDRGIINNDKTGPGADMNNGCGNDPDREDDNNGWCGQKPQSHAASVTATVTVAAATASVRTAIAEAAARSAAAAAAASSSGAVVAPPATVRAARFVAAPPLGATTAAAPSSGGPKVLGAALAHTGAVLVALLLGAGLLAGVGYWIRRARTETL